MVCNGNVPDKCGTGFLAAGWFDGESSPVDWITFGTVWILDLVFTDAHNIFLVDFPVELIATQFKPQQVTKTENYLQDYCLKLKM